jgi:hypothetical protein
MRRFWPSVHPSCCSPWMKAAREVLTTGCQGGSATTRQSSRLNSSGSLATLMATRCEGKRTPGLATGTLKPRHRPRRARRCRQMALRLGSWECRAFSRQYLAIAVCRLSPIAARLMPSVGILFMQGKPQCRSRPVAVCQIRFEPRQRYQFAVAAPRRRSASISRRLPPPSRTR